MNKGIFFPLNEPDSIVEKTGDCISCFGNYHINKYCLKQCICRNRCKKVTNSLRYYKRKGRKHRSWI